MTEAEQGALFEEPPRVPPPDGPWTVTEDGWAYQLLGEDSETLMIDGHRIDDAGIQVVLLHAGQYWEDHWGVMPVRRAWARQLTRCPKHPRWLRWVATPGDWIRWQVFRVLWKLWWSKDPLRQWWRPRWLKWVQHSWNRFTNCHYCAWEQDLRRAERGPDGYRPELVGSYWTWDTDGRPADVNRGRRGYFPVTIVDLDV